MLPLETSKRSSRPSPPPQEMEKMIFFLVGGLVKLESYIIGPVIATESVGFSLSLSDKCMRAAAFVGCGEGREGGRHKELCPKC